MCGIFGFFSEGGIQDYLEEIQESLDVIKYRGPDGVGFSFFNFSQDEIAPSQRFRSVGEANLENDNWKFVMGHRRLAIIDLSDNGLQPMCTPDKSLFIVYNGEIYNYIELRNELIKLGHIFLSQSDTEVILHAYQEWGQGCTSFFNGIWSFAILDIHKQVMFCSRDRFGVKPFYYYFDGQRFLIGSEIKQFLGFPFMNHKVNNRAVYEYLAFSAVEYDDETFFVGINKLLQGHQLLFDLREKNVKINRYYSPEFFINEGIISGFAAERFSELFEDSIRLQLRSDVQVGSCLSGGIDSSSIVGIISKQLAGDGLENIQHTFSSHFEQKEANELEYMQAMINSANVNPHFIFPKQEDFLNDLNNIVWHHDEPFGSTSIFAQWYVYKLVNQHGIKVMLDGQGADEILAGYIGLSYQYFRELLIKKKYFTLLGETKKFSEHQNVPWIDLLAGYLPKRIRKFIKNEDSSTILPSPYSWIREDLDIQYRQQSKFIGNQSINVFNQSELLNNTLYQLTFHNNIQSLLKYEDRNSMAFSVEARVPFLDHRLVEFVFSLPSAMKISNGYTKNVLRESMTDVLPQKIKNRTDKFGFATPEFLLQTGVFKNLILEALDSKSLNQFIDHKQAKKNFKIIIENRITDFSPWRWLNLYVWMGIYNFE